MVPQLCYDKNTQVGGKQRIITIDGYIMPLVSKERLLYLEFIGKPTNEDLASYHLIHLSSHHKWDLTMVDATGPHHSLTTDGGDHGSPTGPFKDQKSYQQESLMDSSDLDVIRIHLQSSLSEFDPNEKSFLLPLENGEQITKKGN